MQSFSGPKKPRAAAGRDCIEVSTVSSRLLQPGTGQSCPNCKNIYAADSRFCRKCGHKREEVARASQQASRRLGGSLAISTSPASSPRPPSLHTALAPSNPPLAKALATALAKATAKLEVGNNGPLRVRGLRGRGNGLLGGLLRH